MKNIKVFKNVIGVILLIVFVLLFTDSVFANKDTSTSNLDLDLDSKVLYVEVKDELLQEKLYMNKKNIERHKAEIIQKEVTQEVIEEPVYEEVIEEVVYEEVVYEEPIYEEPIYVEPTYTPNTIGINGNYYSFVELGYTSETSTIQKYLDSGNVVASTTPFISNDGQSTYFSGHNPGIFSYMAGAIYQGAVVTVVDGSGVPHNYAIIDYAYVDTEGQAVLSTIGKRVIDVYHNGSGQESILIQYCISGTMITWYGIPY